LEQKSPEAQEDGRLSDKKVTQQPKGSDPSYVRKCEAGSFFALKNGLKGMGLTKNHWAEIVAPSNISKEQRIALANKVVDKKLSVRQLKKVIQKEFKKKLSPKKAIWIFRNLLDKGFHQIKEKLEAYPSLIPILLSLLKEFIVRLQELESRLETQQEMHVDD